LFPFLYFVRRAVICVACYGLLKYSTFGIIVLMLNQLLMIIYGIVVKPLAMKEDTRNEHLDNATIIIVIYHLFFFTEYVPHATTR